MTFAKYPVLILIILTLFLQACTSNSNDTIIIEDFDNDSYEHWKAEGTAFTNGPSGADDTHYMVGFLGSGFAASINFENEPATGTLTSAPFKIERKSIHFLIGAHEIHFLPGTMTNPDDQVIQLLVNKKVVRSIVPDEFHAMFWRSWDVTEFKGKMAQIRLIDNDKRMWAWNGRRKKAVISISGNHWTGQWIIFLR